MGTDGIALPVDPDTPAELVTDPQTRAWLLTEAFATNRRTYLSLGGELRQERERVSTARHERERPLTEVRAYLIACVEAGQLDRSRSTNSCVATTNGPYQPRLRVAYIIPGTFDLDPDDLDAHPRQLAEHIAVDLDLGDNLVAGSHTEQVTVTSVQRVDPDHE